MKARAALCLALVISLGSAGIAAADVMLVANLDGASVISATESKATGQAAAILSDDGSVSMDLAFAGLAADATSVEVLIGQSSENGVLIGSLNVGSGKTGDSARGLAMTLTPEQEQAMRDGMTYITVRTIDYPGGAIRGQLVPQTAVTLDRPLLTPADADKANNSTEPSTNR